MRRIPLLVALLLLAGPAAARPVEYGAEHAPIDTLAFSGVQQDAARWDGARWDAARWDGARWDGATWDGSQWDGSRWDGSRWDASRWDGSRWDGSRWDASRWDASRWDADDFVDYDPLYPYAWGHRATNVPGAWSLMGNGDFQRIVCVIDSGVDPTHPDLAGQMWLDPKTGAHGYDFVDGDHDPMDVGGHGTHVASIAAARAGDGYGIPGIANAQIMAVRVIGPDGYGTDEAFAMGVHWCVDHGAHILSMSLSTIEPVKLVASAVNWATANGRLVVMSAGNHHCEECQSPLVKMKGVLTVTAIDPDGQVADFATYGPTVDLGAPGVLIPGAVPGPSWALASGSSQAVPHVSGAAALAWMRNPALTAGQVAELLVNTAQTTGKNAHGPIRVLDVEAAILQAEKSKYAPLAVDEEDPALVVDTTLAGKPEAAPQEPDVFERVPEWFPIRRAPDKSETLHGVYSAVVAPPVNGPTAPGPAVNPQLLRPLEPLL